LQPGVTSDVPIQKSPPMAFWYDKISSNYWDQSTLEPLKIRTDRVWHSGYSRR